MTNEKKFEKINQLRKEGTTLKGACEKVGLSLGSYNYYVKKSGSPWKNSRKNKTKKKKVEFNEVVPTSTGNSKLIAIIGDSSSILEIARQL
jgi:hypothetical protein